MKKNEFIDAGEAESEQYEADEEVQQEFADAQKLESGGVRLMKELREHHSRTPELSGGDVDADWARADVGDETVGGSSPTPGQDVVEQLGEAIGVRAGRVAIAGDRRVHVEQRSVSVEHEGADWHDVPPCAALAPADDSHQRFSWACQFKNP